MTRLDLARRTGLSRATVSSLVGELLHAGLAVERRLPTGAAGRPPAELALDRSAGVAIAVDVGVRHVAVAVGVLYQRNGTTTLFAALDVATGVVLGQCLPKHRHEEFLIFLRTIDRTVPKRLQIHLILDKYHTHKHPQTKAWLAKHPRFHLHLTPTSSSWLNLVERWFRELTDKNIRRSFPNVPDLITSIETYLAVSNANPKPLIWTATADSILEKVRRGRVALNQSAKTETHH